MKTIMLIAGETSGDRLGAALIKALKARQPEVRFIGVGGEQMQAEGLNSLFPMSDIAVMGFSAVLQRLPLLLRRIRDTVEAGVTEGPDIVVSIDSPDFCFRVSCQLKRKLGVACIHYVSPSIWAWRRNRIYKMATFLDHVLALFPFEPLLYQPAHLPCSYVGHPLCQRFTEKHRTVKKEPNRILLLPGSRTHVIADMLPAFIQTALLLHTHNPSFTFTIPCATKQHKAQVEHILAQQPACQRFISALVNPDDTFIAGHGGALATSGTSNIELALMHIPMVIAYKTSALNAFIARRLVRVPYISPVNWIYNDGLGSTLAVPEFLQEQVQPEALYQALQLILNNPQAQLSNLETVTQKLTAFGHSAPADKAADIILRYL